MKLLGSILDRWGMVFGGGWFRDGKTPRPLVIPCPVCFFGNSTMANYCCRCGVAMRHFPRAEPPKMRLGEMGLVNIQLSDDQTLAGRGTLLDMKLDAQCEAVEANFDGRLGPPSVVMGASEVRAVLEFRIEDVSVTAEPAGRKA